MITISNMGYDRGIDKCISSMCTERYTISLEADATQVNNGYLKSTKEFPMGKLIYPMLPRSSVELQTKTRDR